MCVDASPGLQQATSSFQAAAFQPPPDCPLPSCAALERGLKELERLKHTETQLREALAREQVLLDQKDELIRHKDLMSRESDHRLMNGLQMVSSLLSLQIRVAHNAKAAGQGAETFRCEGNVSRNAESSASHRGRESALRGIVSGREV
jgi:hypothetical protein